jgi:hypothetical protein
VTRANRAVSLGIVAVIVIALLLVVGFGIFLRFTLFHGRVYLDSGVHTPTDSVPDSVYQQILNHGLITIGGLWDLNPSSLVKIK